MLDGDKNEIGYNVMHSIDVKECESLEASHGLVRTKISGVFLFKENQDGRSTDVMWQGSSKTSGASSTGKLVTLVHETFTSYVTNLNKFMEAKFMAHQMETTRSQLSAKGYVAIRCRTVCVCWLGLASILTRFPIGSSVAARESIATCATNDLPSSVHVIRAGSVPR